MTNGGWKCGSVVEHLPIMGETSGSIPSTTKTEKKKQCIKREISEIKPLLKKMCLVI